MKRREYIVIPVEIWENENLTQNEMLLYAEIDSFSRYGECFASNEHFSKYLKVSKDRISKLLTSLRRKGFINIELIYKSGTKEIEKRIIRPVSVQSLTHRRNDQEGIGDTDIPSSRNRLDPLGENTDPPIGENAYYNNTSINKQIKSTNNKNIIKEKILPVIDREFEKIWSLYPRKIGKQKAFSYFKKARKVKKVPYETIENGLYRYISYLEQQGTDEQYIMHGSTWFGQEKWQDEYILTGIKQKPKSPEEYLRQKYGQDGVSDFESRRNRKVVNDYEQGIPDVFQGF